MARPTGRQRHASQLVAEWIAMNAPDAEGRAGSARTHPISGVQIEPMLNREGPRDHTC
jgi:hypothetical protein